MSLLPVFVLVLYLNGIILKSVPKIICVQNLDQLLPAIVIKALSDVLSIHFMTPTHLAKSSSLQQTLITFNGDIVPSNNSFGELFRDQLVPLMLHGKLYANKSSSKMRVVPGLKKKNSLHLHLSLSLLLSFIYHL